MRMKTIAFLLLLALPAGATDLLREGDRFPDWKLPDHHGMAVSSAEMAGRTYLLWFYPKAMTSGCTAEGRGLRDRYEEFRRLGAEILGVSYDSPSTNAQFVTNEQFPFRLLSDSDHTLAQATGASGFIPFVARRISYLVGPDGRVIRAYGDVTPDTHADEVLADVRRLHEAGQQPTAGATGGK